MILFVGQGDGNSLGFHFTRPHGCAFRLRRSGRHLNHRPLQYPCRGRKSALQRCKAFTLFGWERRNLFCRFHLSTCATHTQVCIRVYENINSILPWFPSRIIRPCQPLGFNPAPAAKPNHPTCIAFRAQCSVCAMGSGQTVERNPRRSPNTLADLFRPGHLLGLSCPNAFARRALPPNRP